MKDWLDVREDAISSLTSIDIKKHFICFEEIFERILRNVHKHNKKYVERQLKQLDDNFFDYICYWNEKYYGNGFCRWSAVDWWIYRKISNRKNDTNLVCIIFVLIL